MLFRPGTGAILLFRPRKGFSGAPLVAQLWECLQCGRPGSIPGLRRCPGGGHGYPLQDSCLENLDKGVWWATVCEIFPDGK